MTHAHPRLAPGILAASLALCLGLPSCGGHDATPDVRAAYEGYREAILELDGKKALRFVDRNTIAYYERLRDLALHAGRTQLVGLSMLEKLSVLRLRLTYGVDELAGMSGEDLLVQAVRRDWIGQENVDRNELGEVVVSGTTASGPAMVDGVEAPMRWVFHEEQGEWKLDQTAVLPAANLALTSLVEESGLGEEEFVTQLLSGLAKVPVTEEIWLPLAGR